jgi:hypothetical protein
VFGNVPRALDALKLATRGLDALGAMDDYAAHERYRSPRRIGRVRVTLDRRYDTAYIALTDYEDADVARFHDLAAHDIGGIFDFDFHKSGRSLGIRVRMASSALPQALLDEAELRR